MPWLVKKQGSKWVIVKKSTGEVIGHSDTEAKARASVGARYASESGKLNKPK